MELTPGPGRGFNPDAWDGYVANRDRIVAGLVNSPVRNAVVLTGDVHSHWAAEVRQRFDDPSSPAVATELVTTSISSGGDGSDSRDEIAAVLPENPHIRYFNSRRGYIRTRITPNEMRADFRVLPYVSRPRRSGTHRGVIRGARPGSGTARDVNRPQRPSNSGVAALERRR